MALRIAAPKTGSASVIFLHGLGDSARGVSFIAEECFQRPSLQHVNFVLPNAPLRNYPAFGGKAQGWFGLSAVGKPMDEIVTDWEGVQATLATIKELVQAEIDRGIPANRIVVGGFSQGAASSLSFASTYKDNKLAGFLSLSGFLPLKTKIQENKSDINKDSPVFIAHGTADGIVPYKESEVAAKFLETQFGFKNVQFHSYMGLPHSVSEEELTDILDFLELTLSAN